MRRLDDLALIEVFLVSGYFFANLYQKNMRPLAAARTSP